VSSTLKTGRNKMENEDAVTQPAEQTAPIESAPIENEAADTQPTEEESQVEGNQPEKQVSESVPYDRFHEVNTKAKTLAEENAWLRSQMAAPDPMTNTPQLDPESEAGVRAVARQEWDEIQRQSFLNKHGAELSKDPILAGTVRELIARENAQGRMADRESVLAQAKEMLDKSIKPVVKEAQTTAFREGQEKAILKGQTGAVGSTSYKEPSLDDSQLSAEEMRKKFNVPRI
jgi:hypothetical protein